MTEATLYCVMGSPLGHSLSPALHNFLFARHGITAHYELFETDDPRLAARTVRDGRYRGASVTLPLKVGVIPELDELDPPARAVGAVNTLFLREGRLVGTNTDVDGLRASLARLGVSIRGARAVVLGTGGAARVAARVLLDEGAAEVRVGSRDERRAAAFVLSLRALPDLVDPTRARGGAWPPLGEDREPIDLLVNATPVGMRPRAQETPVPREILARVRAVLDLVYNPDPTRLVREAGEAGVPALGGTEMFAVQAARQFEIWTGIRPEIGLVRGKVVELLAFAPR